GLLPQRAEKLVAGSQDEAGGAAVERSEWRRGPSLALELLQGLDTIEDIRRGSVTLPLLALRAQRAQERLALRPERRGQRHALPLSPALSLDEQPAQARVDRQSRQRPAQVGHALFADRPQPTQQ